MSKVRKKHRITNFEYLTPLVLLRGVDAKDLAPSGIDPLYVVCFDFKVSFKHNGVTKEITVRAGLLTDLASVPRAFRWVVGRVGRHLEAAVVHDKTYGDPTITDRSYADAVFLAGMKAAKAPLAALIYRTVRLFGGSSFGGANQYSLGHEVMLLGLIRQRYPKLLTA